MDFSLDEAQVELQQTVARFCADCFPLDAVGSRDGQPVDRRCWTGMAEMGIFGLLAADGRGDSLGPVAGALVFEQLGSHLVPGPVLWTTLTAGLVDGAATGETRVVGVDAAHVVDGSAVVEHADEVDVLVVLGDDGVTTHRVGELAGVEPWDPLDPSTPVGRVSGLGAGDQVGGPDTARELRLLGTVLSAAMLAGLASRALEVARDHALGREQFGVPIGSFQAIKHLLADMYVRTGLAQSATYAAAAVLAQPDDDDRARAASAAKLLAADAAVDGAGTAIQILGGMGFTWAMLPHRLLKRAWVLANSFGAPDHHAQALGSDLVAAQA